MGKRLQKDEYIRKLDNDFKLADGAEDELQSVLAKYLCIRLCGFMEVCLKERIQTFVKDRRSHIAIVTYVSKAIKDITNLNSKKLQAALKSFSEDWESYYVSNVTEEMKDTLGSLYTNRNIIAHGGNVDMSLTQLKAHYSNLKAVADIIDKAVTK